jgi:hypothetical protein
MRTARVTLPHNAHIEFYSNSKENFSRGVETRRQIRRTIILLIVIIDRKTLKPSP